MTPERMQRIERDLNDHHNRLGTIDVQLETSTKICDGLIDLSNSEREQIALLQARHNALEGRFYKVARNFRFMEWAVMIGGAVAILHQLWEWWAP